MCRALVRGTKDFELDLESSRNPWKLIMSGLTTTDDLGVSMEDG